MTEFKISLDEAIGFAGWNLIDKDEITVFLHGFKFRKNVALQKVAESVNKLFLDELLCLYAQIHDENFLCECKGGENQRKCKIDKLWRL